MKFKKGDMLTPINPRDVLPITIVTAHYKSNQYSFLVEKRALQTFKMSTHRFYKTVDREDAAVIEKEYVLTGSHEAVWYSL